MVGFQIVQNHYYNALNDINVVENEAGYLFSANKSYLDINKEKSNFVRSYKK